VRSALKRDVNECVTKILGNIPYRLRVEASLGRPESHLAEMAKEAGAHLLVVGLHQYRVLSDSCTLRFRVEYFMKRQ
jgi:hypothetical protein